MKTRIRKIIKSIPLKNGIELSFKYSNEGFIQKIIMNSEQLDPKLDWIIEESDSSHLVLNGYGDILIKNKKD
jgi:hypothetical protein